MASRKSRTGADHRCGKLWRAFQHPGLRPAGKQVTRGRNYPAGVISREHLRRASIDLVQSLFPPAKGIRLVGVTVSNFEGRSAGSDEDLPLFAAASTGRGQTASVLPPADAS